MLGLSELKVGSKIWELDRDNWRYRKTLDPKDRWQEREIIGETKQSWIVGQGSWQRKINKKTGDTASSKYGYGKPVFCFSQEALDLDCWRVVHKDRIGNMVLATNNVTMLKQVAEIIGYDAELEEIAIKQKYQKQLEAQGRR